MTEDRAKGAPLPPLLQVRDLRREFRGRGLFPFPWRGRHGVRAVDGVSFEIRTGEAYGLVGESGSGKTTAGRIIAGLERADSGEVLFHAPERRIQMIFQDPYSSLNPRMRAGDALEEPLKIIGFGDRAQRRKRVRELLRDVGLSEEDAAKYPHEFSGGQRQRIGIARALIADPALIICDEPVSSLDVSIQAQILTLLRRIQTERNLSLLFITHDLRVARHISDRVGVMYRGRLVEEAGTDALFASPLHPYTRTLLAALPRICGDTAPGPEAQAAMSAPPVAAPGSWERCCAFLPRCPIASERCRREVPPLAGFGGGRRAACFTLEPIKNGIKNGG